MPWYSCQIRLSLCHIVIAQTRLGLCHGIVTPPGLAYALVKLAQYTGIMPCYSESNRLCLYHIIITQLGLAYAMV